MDNDELLEKAKSAIDNLFSDTSVSRAKCRENLEDLQSEIETKLDALRADDEREMQE
jgi:hypothetical protein